MSSEHGPWGPSTFDDLYAGATTLEEHEEIDFLRLNPAGEGWEDELCEAFWRAKLDAPCAHPAVWSYHAYMEWDL